MRVLAIDPGERAGYAVATFERTIEDDGILWDCVTAKALAVEVETYGIATLKDMALALHASTTPYDVVVYEDYRIAPSKLRAHTGSNVPTLQLIGMIRCWAWLNPKLRLVTQQPAHKRTADKVIATNPVFAEFKRIIDGAPSAHDDAHHTDALRHLAYWAHKELT